METETGRRSESEVEVTPEMIRAGIEEFDTLDFHYAGFEAAEFVAEIYRAMHAARAKLG